MIICKWPVPPDDHFKVAGSGVTRGDGTEGGEEGEGGERGGEEILAQECTNWKNNQAFDFLHFKLYNQEQLCLTSIGKDNRK